MSTLWRQQELLRGARVAEDEAAEAAVVPQPHDWLERLAARLARRRARVRQPLRRHPRQDALVAVPRLAGRRGGGVRAHHDGERLAARRRRAPRRGLAHDELRRRRARLVAMCAVCVSAAGARCCGCGSAASAAGSGCGGAWVGEVASEVVRVHADGVGARRHSLPAVFIATAAVERSVGDELPQDRVGPAQPVRLLLWNTVRCSRCCQQMRTWLIGNAMAMCIDVRT
jgi:hypothetical protein